jgi:hypothetical protein
MYLYSGRRGNYMPLAPRWWYAEDHASNIGAYRDVAKYCRAHGLSYFYFTTGDLEREVGDEDKQAIQQSVATNPELERVFQAGSERCIGYCRPRSRSNAAVRLAKPCPTKSVGVFLARPHIRSSSPSRAVREPNHQSRRHTRCCGA